MISLNDVLLAMSNIPVDDPIAEIWGRGLQGGYRIIEYTGTLPVTINANGDALIDYRIYGADGVVGERTENLFDPAKSEMNCYYDTSGTKRNTNSHNTSDYIPVESGKTYMLSLARVNMGFGIYLNLWDDGKQFVTNLLSLVNPDGSYSFSSPINGYIRFNWLPNYTYNIMLIEGSTAPASYIPYGYKLPMTVQSANLFDKNAQDVDKGFVSSTRLNSNGTTQNQYHFNVSEYIAVQPETSFYFGNISTNANFEPSECFYDSEKNFISSYTPRFEKSFVVTTPTNAAYVRVSYNIDNTEQIIIEGTEPPSTYIPYSRTDIPVYIGENQLDAIGEYRDYVDYDTQKIVRQIKEYTFTGNEKWVRNGSGFYTVVSPRAFAPVGEVTLRSSHFTGVENRPLSLIDNIPYDGACLRTTTSDCWIMIRMQNITTTEECNAYFRNQHDNGTPVKIWYILETPVEGDSPAPLPEIPTIDGTTTIDYDGTPKPSQVYVKYKGKE